MSSTADTPGPEEQPAPAPLPELSEGLLDAQQIEQLLRDIELCAQVSEIIPKFAPRAHVPENPQLTLTDARQLLDTRAVRGLQIRYRYDGHEWWDTIMVVGDQFRVVRIRHEFGPDGPNA